jgi:hypothetical protein
MFIRHRLQVLTSFQLNNFYSNFILFSSIKGIRIITNDTILSVSIDQRVIVWKFNLDIEHLSLKLEPISSYISCIADISSFCATFDSYVLIKFKL